MRFFFLLAFLLPFSVFASDVQIITDLSKGQGFLYSKNDKCYVITPSHVIEGANKISLITPARKTYSAKLVKNFDIDLAMLEVSNAKKLCKKASFSKEVKLTSLLKIYEDGVLKSKLGDGSTLQTKVDIIGVDESEFLQIKPKKERNILKQGYSGSVFFIANQPAGILIEVDDGSGFVYRSDALMNKLDEYFYPGGKPQEKKEEVAFVADKFTGRLAKGQKKEFKLNGEANSPLMFHQIPSTEYVYFVLQIVNSKNKVVYEHNYDSRQNKRFAFTPLKAGTYTVRVTGTHYDGSFGFSVEQWALNSELRGEGNVIEAGDEFTSQLAINAVAEYKFHGEANSPLMFRQIPSDEYVYFVLQIVNSKDKVVYEHKFDSRQNKRFAFTPLKAGIYTVRATGTHVEGSFGFSVEQWALNSELRGEGNVFEVGDEFSNQLAINAIAEYKFHGEANSPLMFQQIPSDEYIYFVLQIVNSKDKVVYEHKYDSRQNKRFAFTPLTAGIYTVRVTGTHYEGSFGFSVEQWALNSELRGEGNVIEAGDEFTNQLAINAVAEYKFHGEVNSPLMFQQIPSDEYVYFVLQIVNSKDKVVYEHKFDSRQNKRFAFTPLKAGIYTVRVTGTHYEGSFGFGVKKGE